MFKFNHSIIHLSIRVFFGIAFVMWAIVKIKHFIKHGGTILQKETVHDSTPDDTLYPKPIPANHTEVVGNEDPVGFSN